MVCVVVVLCVFVCFNAFVWSGCDLLCVTLYGLLWCVLCGCVCGCLCWCCLCICVIVGCLIVWYCMVFCVWFVRLMCARVV